MNKNLLLAISLMILTFFFFESPLYNKLYEKIFNKPRVTTVENPIKDNQQNEPLKNNNESKTNFKENEKKENIISKIDSITSSNENTRAEKGDTIWIENDKIFCKISKIGARIISLKMKEYRYQQKDTSTNQYIEIVGNSEIGGGNLVINGQNYDTKKFMSSIQEKKIKITKSEKVTIDFIEEQSKVTKRFMFQGNSYKIGFQIISDSLKGKSLIVGWKCGISESENKSSSIQNASGMNEPIRVHVFDTKNVTHFQHKKVEKEEETGFFKWAAITSKYFLVAMVSDSVRNADLLLESYDTATINKEGKKGISTLNYAFQMRRSSEENTETFWIFAGPSSFKLLQSFHEKFQKVLFSGWEWLLRADMWFPVICEWTLWLLISINGTINDYGITILILTIITRLITYPLSQSSMKSMSRIKEIQPKINHIRERYKTNPRKMNEEIMALYKKEGVNPFNPGCLPMFLQMPILFALFIVLRKAIELRGAHTVLLPWVNDLSQPESLISLTGIFPDGIPIYGSSIALLPIIMAILTFIQNKMTIKDPNQKMMIYLMPPFLLVLFNNFPAGLVLYWTFSNALGILQQYMIEKSIKTKAIQIPEQQIPQKRKTHKSK